MHTHKPLLTLAITSALLISSVSYAATTDNKSTVIQAENVNWGYLNPLRGDKSPGAANLWGDRTKDGATGMLVRFKKGFSSPPHIHNISYRGVVIKGLMHNDDPKAEKSWMPTGSFWTQPAGKNHITAANSSANLIYLEIDSGPYLVKPSKQKFDDGETAVNLHLDNMVWSKPDDMQLADNNQVQMTNLWGNKQPGQISGSLLKLPAGYQGQIQASSDEFKVVLIKGTINYQSAEQQEVLTLAPGSFFNSRGQFSHEIKTSEEAILYIRTNGEFSF